MTRKEFSEKYGQILLPLVTPFDEKEEIDYKVYEDLIEYLIKNDLCDSLIVTGTTGEASLCTFDERVKLMETAVRVSAGRKPVIAGTGCASTKETVALTKKAEELGIDLCMVVCPFYNKPTQPGVYNHYKTIAGSVGVNILLYNIPIFVGINIDAPTVHELAKIPNIIGINSGAGLFVLIAASVFPSVLWLPPLAAFLGALATALIIFGISLGASTSRLTVVLAGIAITSVFGAGMNTILIVNPDAYVGSSAFLVGGLAGVLMDDLAWPAAYILGGLVVALLSAGKLNIMALGDDTAHALGMNVGATRLAMLGLAAVLAGAAVSFAGLLGFVGLIIPHLVRFFVGHDNRIVLPLSAVCGAAFVVVCDLLSRVLFAPYEVPVGILMAFLGGPFFIYLILKNRRGSLD